MSLRTDRDSYLVEETVVVTLENVDAHEVGYAVTCSLVLEGGASDALWTVVRRVPPLEPPADPRSCYSVWDGLAAGESTAFYWPLDDALVAGRYRFTMNVEVRRGWGSASEQVVLHSEPFFLFPSP